MMRFIRFFTAAAVIGGLAACKDTVSVDNLNNPDRARVLARPADVEGLGASQFQQVINGTIGDITRPNTGMLTAAFENASALANNGLGPRSAIPRGSIGNGRGNAYADDNFGTFRVLSVASRNVSDVLNRAKSPGFALSSTGDEQRLKAFAHFVHGVTLGYLAATYDSIGVPRPSDGATDVPPLEPYAAVNTYALGELDSALVYARKSGTSSLPVNWLTGPTGPTVSVATFIRVIRSYKAKFRAQVARTPAERAAVNWAEVIADATNGLTADLMAGMNPSAGWDYAWLSSTLHFRDPNWHQLPYYIIGMADVSGAYDTWLATARDSRTPFLIQTPDLRFPQGATRPGQQSTCPATNLDCPLTRARQYIRNRPPGEDQAAEGWRSSFYDHYRWRGFADAGRVGLFPIFTVTEVDMLAAEGYIRTGNIAAAATLIDKTRTTSGLPALSGAVTTATDPVPGGASCVPRVPVGPNYTSTACGNTMEAMKWEKRMETAYTAYGAWYLDSRGWGDLPEGTPLSWPVPFQELDARKKAIYDLGGIGQPGGAGQSAYGFGTQTR
jgi:hypothetical protein